VIIVQTQERIEKPANKGKAASITRRFFYLSLREAGIGIALVIITLIFCIVAPYFATTDNFLKIFVQISINTVLAVGMTFAILIAGIDLSVGAVLALATVVGAKIMISKDLPVELAMILAILACMGVGIVCGFINGFITERWKIHSFIVTLGMLNIARGASQVVSDNATINGLPQPFVDFGNVIIWGIVPTIFLITVVIVGIAWFILKYTVFGRYIYAIGNNEEAVRLSGHNPAVYKIMAYTICGLCAGLGGVVWLLRLNVGSPIAGVGYELNAIAAVIIGGTTMSGGRGSVIGTFLGACILQVLNTGLQLMGVGDNFRPIVIGLVIVLAVILDTYRAKYLLNARRV